MTLHFLVTLHLLLALWPLVVLQLLMTLHLPHILQLLMASYSSLWAAVPHGILQLLMVACISLPLCRSHLRKLVDSMREAVLTVSPKRQ